MMIKEIEMKKGTMMRVIRAIVSKDALIYNDKLADGTRSVKIWDWGTPGEAFDYSAVAQALTEAGFAVEIRNSAKHENRLHVKYPVA